MRVVRFVFMAIVVLVFGTNAMAVNFLGRSLAVDKTWGKPLTATESGKAYQIRLGDWKTELEKAPFENSSVKERGLEMEIPVSAGKTETFRIYQYSMMEPGLQREFPAIKTFHGNSLSSGRTIRIDLNDHELHVMVLGGEADYFLDPWNKDHPEILQAYSRNELSIQDRVHFQELEPIEVLEKGVNPSVPGIMVSGSQLRTYRIAVAATGEYTQFHGGTVSLALAAMVTTMNRVNGVFEREVAVRLVMVNSTSQLIYSNPATDPYSNGDPSTMINENQTNLTNTIGNGAYDIGHVFGTNSGGLAMVSSVCNSSLKAGGVTGSSNPVGDAFDIDYVAHEIGHQFGARHTFNSVSGSCAGNRTSTSAYEPGSGTTIMAYAGICGTDNIQLNSNAYFHYHSHDQIMSFVMGQATCASISNTGNSTPVITAPSGGFTIPKSTPFKLSAVASDPNGDALTYCWEQSDLGPAGGANGPTGNAPIFRSFTPVSSPERVFPAWSDILNNTQTKGEIMASYGRNLSFRITARDNRSGGGGVNAAAISFSISDSIGPFVLTAPNAGGTWIAGSIGTVSWSVAKTNRAPVNCQAVNIWLSVDGGQNFSIPLVLNTPNDGTQNFVVPNIPTTTGRVLIEAVNNIFFDVSNVNLSITGAAGVVATPVITPGPGTFNTGINVNITCSTPGAVIYYTTNGNTPVPGTGFTKVFGGPFGVFSATTVRALAVRQGFSNSAVAVANYAPNISQQAAATPVISPGTGTYSGPQTVSISCATPGSIIYFTTNGNVPLIGTTYTRTYSTPFLMPGTGTVRAMAVASGMANSAIAVANFTISNPAQVAAPVISPSSGSFTAPLMVSISSATSGAIIYYTTSGNEPLPGTSYTRVYSGPFTISANTTIRAFGVKADMLQSTTSVANLSVTDPALIATPVISPGTGTYSTPQTVSISCSTPGVTIYYTTTGNIPVVGTGFTRIYTGPFQVSSTTTIRAIAVRTGMTTSNVAAAFLTLNIPGRQAVVKVNSSGLEVFPNPVQSKLNVRWGEELDLDLKISVFNALGAEVLTYLVGKGQSEYSMDVQGLRTGIYFVKSDRHPNLIRILKQ